MKNNEKRFSNNSCSFAKNSIFSKMNMNLSNMLGPAIICLPFVMQKSGFIPTIIALLFLCLFSNFSSFCLTETGRLLRGSKNLYSKTLDYCHIIDYLIKDPLFAMSSKLCVIINHLLYSILCIITLYKAVNIFIFTKLDIKNFLTNLLVMSKIKVDAFHAVDAENQNFIYRVGNEILNSEELLYGTILFSFSYVSLIPSLLNEEENCDKIHNNSNYINKKAIQYSAFIGLSFKLIFSICFCYLINFGPDFSMKDYLSLQKDDHNQIYFYLIISLGLFLVLTLYNGVINHVKHFQANLIYESERLQYFSWIISIFGPWILSLMLLVKGNIFLNILNWYELINYNKVLYYLKK